ncbi:exo-alpha-sialidase [Lysobacter sp. SG-8]|uniref:Exo-alpha-sialidase n=2 Tax=Marilutibacter penaei TaxID=2759900 RepID=A0A7W3U2A6_9GAMM|nr:exo-alpha-sialidase [Lysobacter penaei]
MGFASGQDEVSAPYTIAPGLFDAERPDDLGLRPPAGTRTATVFAPEAFDRFNNGVVLIAYRDHLYAQWQSSARDEDAPDTRVLYSRSADGDDWSPPRELVGSGEGARMHSSGGWWTDGDTLVAFVNVWPTGFQSGDGGFTDYVTSRDGEAWSSPQPVRDANGEPVRGVIEQDPHAIGEGRLVTAFHLQPGLRVAPHFTDDPLGIRGWTRGLMPNLPHEGPQSRELEPSLFLRDGCAVMVFRDQASSHRQLASESCDRGLTWTRPGLTGMPDARSKQSAGNLPDGTAYLVNAPNAGKPRIPLAVTLSDDGRHFDRAFLLRGGEDLQPLRHEGRYKRPGYHYPKSVVWNGALWIGYATNKEDVEVTRVPLASLRRVAPSPDRDRP